MKSDKIIEAIENIDDDIITDADNGKKQKSRPFRIVVFVALFISIAIAGAFGVSTAFRADSGRQVSEQCEISFHTSKLAESLDSVEKGSREIEESSENNDMVQSNITDNLTGKNQIDFTQIYQLMNDFDDGINNWIYSDPFWTGYREYAQSFTYKGKSFADVSFNSEDNHFVVEWYNACLDSFCRDSGVDKTKCFDDDGNLARFSK